MAELTSEQLAEVEKIQRSFKLISTIAFVVLVGGSTFYHFVEKLSWLNAFYFSTITLMTVGYGDITPKTDAGKIFTIFYVIIGIGILATFANLFLKNAVAKRAVRHSTKD